MKCKKCNGMGSYEGVFPPGVTKRIKCGCGDKLRNQPDKFCVKCLKNTRLLVHCSIPTQRK